MNNTYPHLLVLLAVFIVAGSFIAPNALMGTIDEFALNFLRFIIATLCLTPYVIFNKHYRQQIKRTLTCAIVTSFFYNFYFVFLLIALRNTHVVNTSSLYTLTPVFTAILSIMMFKSTISTRQWLTYLIAIVGTLVVIFKGQISALISMTFNKGDAVYLLGVICMAGYTVSLKKLAPKVDTIVLTFTSLSFGSLWMGLVLLMSGQSIEISLLAQQDYLAILYLAIPATLITSFLFQTANITLTPNQISAYGYLCPAFVVLINFVIFHESASPATFVGIAISAIATWFLLSNKSITTSR